MAELIVAIEFDETFEECDIAKELVASFRVGHSARAIPLADGGDGGDNVDAVSDRRTDGFEVMMLGQDGAVFGEVCAFAGKVGSVRHVGHFALRAAWAAASRAMGTR